jgi:hypothetical protein
MELQPGSISDIRFPGFRARVAHKACSHRVGSSGRVSEDRSNKVSGFLCSLALETPSYDYESLSHDTYSSYQRLGQCSTNSLIKDTGRHEEGKS